jgi:threonine dehydratase
MSELNPNHPVTQAVHDHWHKLAAFAVMKAGGHIVITADDIDAAAGMAIVVQEKLDGLHLRIVEPSAAMLLASADGGLPS